MISAPGGALSGAKLCDPMLLYSLTTQR